MSRIIDTIMDIQARMADLPPFVTQIRLCCSGGVKDAWFQWFEENLGDRFVFGTQVHWDDWDAPDCTFPKPGFLAFYSDNSMSWTELNEDQSVPIS